MLDSSRCWRVGSGTSLGNCLLENTYLFQNWSEASRYSCASVLGISGLVNLLALCSVAKENNIVLDLRMISRMKS